MVANLERVRAHIGPDVRFDLSTADFNKLKNTVKELFEIVKDGK